MGYESDIALEKAYKAYQDAIESQEDISGAFSDYKKAYEKSGAEQPLRDEMEQLAQQLETISYARLQTPFDVTGRGFNPKYEIQEAEIEAKMEKKWPGWYQGYLDWKIYQLTGGQPRWYRELKEHAATVLDLVAQLLPLLPYARGAASSVRPWVPAPGRAPAPPPVRTLPPVRPLPWVPAPGAPQPAPQPGVHSEVPGGFNRFGPTKTATPTVTVPAVPSVTMPVSEWWKSRTTAPPGFSPVPTGYSTTQGGGQVWTHPETGQKWVPSVDVRSYVPVKLWPTPFRSYTPTPTPTPSPAPPSGPTPAPSEPTSMAPPIVSSGANRCPPGQFWDGRECRGSIGRMPGAIPGGISGGASPPPRPTGRIMGWPFGVRS